MSAVRALSFFVSAVSSLALAQTALAQIAEQTPADQSTNQSDVQQASSADIVVTGSRTITNGDSSPVPLTVVTTDTLQDIRPTSLTESIQVFPTFSGSRGQTSNASATGGVGAGNGTAAQLNLRNIGPNRNLVLLDGRRVPPTSITNIVDADVIPQLLIQRVDVVTGGVSAVYGSDAVTGVINFVTDTKFTGIKGQAYAGISELGDGGLRDVAIAGGINLFGGRGHIEASYEFRDDDGVLFKSSRDFFTRPVIIGNGTSQPYQLIENATLSTQPFGGRISCGTACAVNGQYFSTDGVLSPFVNGTVYPGTTTQSGGAGGYQDHVLKASQTMHQAYGRFDYELSDSLKFFASFGYTNKRNALPADSLILNNFSLRRDNPFLGAQYQAAIPGATFTLGKVFRQAGRLTPVPESTQAIGTAGLQGDVGRFNWNVVYVYGFAKLETVLNNNIDYQRLSAATDAVRNASGQIVCYAATVSSAYADCVPLNLFGPTSASAAALDYVFADTNYVARTRQDDVVADISGDLFDGWAGPIRAALSAEWRRQSFRSESEAQPTQFADCTNLRYNCVATGSRTIRYGNTFPASPRVSQQVWEAAAELNVPLFTGANLNGAARYTSYETVGDYWTWKIGADWELFDGLRLRGTISRDIRAPTLSDLFAPTSVVVGNYTDLLTGTTALVPGFNLANASLTAEIGKTWTAGVVWRPTFAPGLSIAVDYFNLKISDAITTVQGFANATQNGCFTDQVQLYCDLIVRNSATNAVSQYLIQPINLSEISTSGVDGEINYGGRLLGRAASLRLLTAWQPHIYYRQPSVPTIDQGGVAFGAAGLTASPEWRITGIASLSPVENLRFDVLYRWRSALKVSKASGITFAGDSNNIDPYGNVSLNVAWTIDQRGSSGSEFFVNIQNLLDNDPPIAAATGSAASPGGFNGYVALDDPIGRYFTAGFRVRF
jgi:iron complex outermembrane receptor protein